MMGGSGGDAEKGGLPAGVGKAMGRYYRRLGFRAQKLVRLVYDPDVIEGG